MQAALVAAIAKIELQSIDRAAAQRREIGAGEQVQSGVHVQIPGMNIVLDAANDGMLTVSLKILKSASWTNDGLWSAPTDKP